jgi:hypothetical protein
MHEKYTSAPKKILQKQSIMSKHITIKKDLTLGVNRVLSFRFNSKNFQFRWSNHVLKVEHLTIKYVTSNEYPQNNTNLWP